MIEVKPQSQLWPTVAAVSSARSKPSPHAPVAEPLSAASLTATLAAARRLRCNARAGTAGEPLRGKNLALLLDPAAAPDLQPLRLAAQALGARVAELRYAEPASTGDTLALGRMLGRMYDAVDCEGIPEPIARQIEQEAGVPVFQGLCRDEHSARTAADLMTLQEQRSSPGTPLLFLGDSTTMRAGRFVAAARQAGFHVRMDEHGRNDVHAPLLVETRDSPRWTLLAGQPIDEEWRSENHRCVIQALLLEALVRG